MGLVLFITIFKLWQHTLRKRERERDEKKNNGTEKYVSNICTS